MSCECYRTHVVRSLASATFVADKRHYFDRRLGRAGVRPGRPVVRHVLINSNYEQWRHQPARGRGDTQAPPAILHPQRRPGPPSPAASGRAPHSVDCRTRISPTAGHRAGQTHCTARCLIRTTFVCGFTSVRVRPLALAGAGTSEYGLGVGAASATGRTSHEHTCRPRLTNVTTFTVGGQVVGSALAGRVCDMF